MNEFFILIDFNNYFNRFYYANEKDCVSLYLKFLQNVIKFFDPKWLCNCLDGPISFRKVLYEQYKSTRPEKPTTFKENYDNCIENLKIFGYSYQNSKTLEAEDLANLFVQNNRTTNFIALSGDKDFLFLEQENCKIFDYVNKRIEGKYELFEQRSFVKKGFKTKKEFELYLTLRGDESDNIPGVKKIGDKKARLMIEKFGTYENIKEKLFLLKEPIEKPRNFLNCEENSRFDIWKSELKEVIADEENFYLSNKLVRLFEGKWKFDLDRYLTKEKEF